MNYVVMQEGDWALETNDVEKIREFFSNIIHEMREDPDDRYEVQDYKLEDYVMMFEDWGYDVMVREDLSKYVTL